MLTIRPSRRLAWLVLSLSFCVFVAGCLGEKPVGDAQKYHPEGISIDLEKAKIPGK